MANTKNSQAAKIRKQIIAWLQDPAEIEVVSESKFPGIQGIRAVKLREMLGAQGYVASVVMGAVSAAPSIEHRIKKATLKPREVYYYYDDSDQPATPTAVASSAASVAAAVSASAAPQAATAAAPVTTAVTVSGATTANVAGLAGTDAFAALQVANHKLAQRVDELLTAAQQQAPLDDADVDFLTTLTEQLTQQSDLLQNFATQARIASLRRK